MSLIAKAINRYGTVQCVGQCVLMTIDCNAHTGDNGVSIASTGIGLSMARVPAVMIIC